MDWYALATYRADGGQRPGFVLGDRVFDLAECWRAAHPTARADMPWLDGLDAILAEWASLEAEIAALAAALGDMVEADALQPVAAETTQLAAPFSPNRIFAAAANYVEHANEMGTKLAAKAESNPYIFLKAASSVVGPGEPVRLPPLSDMVDWEVELGAVVGRAGKNVPIEEALDYVAGYTVINDVSARDLNTRDDFPFKFDWFQGKSFDTFAPLGPWLVPRRLIPDPQALRLSLSVNGESMQDGTTAEMIFTVAEQVAYLSNILALAPGDVIATGTPTGVGMSRGIFLKENDVMVAAIEGIGVLENPVVADSRAEISGKDRDETDDDRRRAAGGS